MSAALLRLDGVTKAFPTGGGRRVPALTDVSFDVAAGETVGLVGGSGAGKSTVARLVVGLERADRGRVVVAGRDIAALRGRHLRAARRGLHLVFQDPYAALAPTMTVGAIVAEPLVIHGVGSAAERRRRARSALAEVALGPPARYAERHPHELSGGERQRVALARALVLAPRLVIADEPTAMLDASRRVELLTLMANLQTTHGIAYLFITHDLALTQGFCDRLVVLRHGRVVEQGLTADVLGCPSHPYTTALVDAVRALQPPALGAPAPRCHG